MSTLNICAFHKFSSFFFHSTIHFTKREREREREMKDTDSANEKETKTTSKMNTNKSTFDSVVVHPLVLLSVVDHFKRVDEVINNEACFFSSFFPFLRSDDDDDVNLSLFISLSLCSLERDDFIDIFSLLFLLNVLTRNIITIRATRTTTKKTRTRTIRTNRQNDESSASYSVPWRTTVWTSRRRSRYLSRRTRRMRPFGFSITRTRNKCTECTREYTRRRK